MRVTRAPGIIACLTCSLLPLTLSGCASESRAAREIVAQQVEAESGHPRDPLADAMKPMLGLWAVDPEATMSANESLPNDVRAAIRRDLTMYPFTLEITDRDYISRSAVKVNADRYAVTRVDGEVVTIALKSDDGVERPRDRETKLRTRDGRLLINTRGPVTCVFSRSAAGRQ